MFDFCLLSCRHKNLEPTGENGGEAVIQEKQLLQIAERTGKAIIPLKVVLLPKPGL